MNPSDNKRLFFDMQEHPENYSDEQLEQMMAELDKKVDAGKAWKRFEPESPFMIRKIAAVFIAVAFLGVMSLACYRAFYFKTTTDSRQTTDTLTVKTERFYVDVQDGDTIFRFENIRLDSILSVVSRHYERQVVFKDPAPARLRFYITCRTSHTLNEFVEVMNMFDGFRIRQDFDILYVESDEKKEGKR